MIKVLHIKCLTVKENLALLRGKGEIKLYLPTHKPNKNPNRQFLWNLSKSFIKKADSIVNILIFEELGAFIAE